jgi:hypothetical protein
MNPEINTFVGRVVFFLVSGQVWTAGAEHRQVHISRLDTIPLDNTVT